MLQKIKYETLNYGRFEKMRKKFLSADFEPEDCKELELSHQHSKELPTAKCFEIVKNLSVLILSHNQISRFDPKIITKGAPQLEVLDLSFNKIEVLDDIVDLGCLVHLKILEFSSNPLCSHLSRINTVIELFYPEKYKKYDPVKILTASYQQHPPTRLSLGEEEQMKKDLQVFYRFNEELEAHETRKSVSKYSHRNTLAKYAVEPCPVPRKSRFKNLEYLNGQVITKLDMMRASGKDKIKDIIEDQNEQKIQVKKIHRENEEFHKKYLERYIKRIAKMNEDNMQTNVRSIKQSGDGAGGEDDLKYLSKVDEALSHAGAQKLDQRVFASDIWQQPLDMLYKDSTFSISMKEYKEMNKEYDIEKKKKEEHRKLKQAEKRTLRRGRVLKKLQKAGIQPVTEEELKKLKEDSDFEAEEAQQGRRGRKKMKGDTNLLDEKEYSSSESEQSERMYKKERSSFSLSQGRDIKDFDDFDDEDEQESATTEEEKQKQRKKQQAQQSGAEVDVLELKKRLDNTKLKNQAQSQKKPFSVNVSEKKLAQKKEETKQYTKKTLETAAPVVTEPQKQESIVDINGIPEKEEKNENEMDRTVVAQSTGNPNVKNEGVLAGMETVGVSRYEFFHDKSKEQNRRDQFHDSVKNSTSQTFQIKNKVFANHNQIREEQQRQFSAKSSGRVGQNVMFKSTQKRDRSSSDSLSESEGKPKGMPKKSIQSRPMNSFKSTGTLKIGTVENKMNLKSSVGDSKSSASLLTGYKAPGTSKEESMKKAILSDIPTEELVPTVEQGLDPQLRTNALFNPENEMHQQIQRFKQNLENCNMLKESIQELDKKIGPNLSKKKPVSQFANTISYNNVFKYLKDTVKDFKIMRSHDLANYLEYKVTRKKIDPMSKKKMSTFELNTIIAKANDYDQKEGPRLREKDINEQLRHSPKQQDFEERMKLYDGLDILEEIKLKKMKISKEHLRRIEKKEIERAEHDARLAYHYYKLRNHVQDGNLEKYLKRLNIGLDGKNDQGKIQFKKKVDNQNSQDPLSSRLQRQQIPQHFARVAENEKKKEVKGFVGHFEELKKLKREIIEPREIPEVHLSGFIVEKYPDINEWANSRLYVPQPKLTFEELMEQNDRKVKDEFQKSRNNQVLTIEEQMKKYAQEFKEKEQQRDELRQRIEGYVKNGTNILNDFLKQEILDIDKRFDENVCMNDYIKLMREDKLPKRIPASQLKKAQQ